MDTNRRYFNETSYASTNTLNSFVNKKKKIKKYIDLIEEDILRANIIDEENAEFVIVKDSIYENFINHCE